MSNPTTAREWFERYFCRCGNGNPDVVLRDYLAMFRPIDADERDEETREYEPDHRMQCIDLDASDAFREKYGNDVLHLIGYLLDGAGLIEHGGSVISSAWLTPLGIEVKDSIEAGDFGEDDE